MKNLNKFTKAELINKYKRLEDQNSNQTQSKYQSIFKILNYIVYFKALILKITLITFVIKWIKKYSLVKKLWHIFSAIGSTLLGFSLIDIYSWDLISWIQDTSIYKWYIELFSKNELPPEISSKNSINISERTSIETIGIQTESEINNGINRWFNKQEIIKEPEVVSNEEINSIDETNKYKYYFIVGSIVIMTGIIYYYFNDIKPGDAGNAIIDKIKSSRSWFNNDSTNIINNNTGNNQMNIPTNINQEIQLVDNTQPTPSNVTTILTSPSLENLNEQAENSWSESISSPDSDKTVTPASISESNIPSSSSLNTEGSSTSSSITTISNFIKDNWRKRFTDEVNDKINFIESTVNSDIDLDEGIKLSDYYAYIINEYNKDIDLYNNMKSNSNPNISDLNMMRQSLYYFREWIAEYQSKIFPTSNVTIEVGSIQDSPKILTKNIV